MKNKTAARILTVLLSFIIIASSVIIPSVFADDTKDAVKPVFPFSVSSFGGTSSERVEANALFSNDYNSALKISSATQKDGIIADLSKLSGSVSGNGNVVTPLVSGGAFGTDSMVTVTPQKNLTITEENGFKVTYSGSYQHNGNLTSSKAGGYIEYSRKQSLIGADGILFYLKIDGPNIVNIEIEPNDPENKNRWTYDWEPWLMLKKGASYSYMSLDGSSWKTATAVAREGSDVFGAMNFTSAFEGYVKIPFSSITNDCGFIFDSNQDSFEKIIVRTKGIGGSYGNFAAGPFFVLDSDSSSKNITVNTAEPSDAPTAIGGRVEGFKENLSDVKSVLFYVKTETANRISVTLNIADDYITEMPDLELLAGSEVKLLKKGSNNWTETTVVASETLGAVEFSSAFEGYVKIPLDAFAENDKTIAVLTEIDYVTGFEFSLAGVGGKYKTVTVAPFLMTEDTGKTDFDISDDYANPTFESIKAVPVTGGNFYSAGGTGYTEIMPLDGVVAKGVKITASAETKKASAMESAMTSFGDYYTVNDTASTFFTSDTVIIYVKTDSANQLAIKMYDSDWAELFLKANTSYSFAAFGDDEWTTAGLKTVTYANKDYGVIEFDSAFEGYIKLNLADNLGTSSQKKFYYMYFYPMALGGEYGTVTAGPMFSVTADSPSTEIEVPDEYKPQPIEATPLTGGKFYSANGNSTTKAETLAPLAWTNAEGVKIIGTAEKANASAIASMNSSFGNYFTVNDAAAKYFDSDTVIFYIKTDSANDIAMKMYESNWSEIFLKGNTAYSYAKVGDSGWTDATVKTENDGGNSYGVLSFDSAFEGYVKLDLARNLGTSSNNEFIYMYFYPKALGGQYGSVTAGPIFSVKKDSTLTEIVLPDEFMTGSGSSAPPPTPPADDIDSPVRERLENVLKYSADGSRQGYWFAVGDSTRYHLGYPAYRLVADKLAKEYNIIPSLFSESELTAEEFAESKADELIAEIPDDGKGSIVDISLGLYDEADAETTAGYITAAIEKIKAAKPYAVVVYTGANLVMDKAQNEKSVEINKAVYEDEDVFAVNVTEDAFSEYYTQYYSDDILPNVAGYRVIANYIKSCYFGDEFEKITTTDSAAITLPEGATLVNTGYKTLHSVGISYANGLLKVGNEFATSLVLSGNSIYTGKRPYDAGNEILFDLTKPVGGDNCIMFYIDIPAANRIGLVAYKDNEKNVNEDFVMLLDNSEFDILADGEREWKTLKTVKGSDVEGQLPGALEFTSAFKGWVRIPYKAFGLTGSLSNGDGIRALVVRLSELGGAYGEVKVGTFATMTRPSYVAKDVWKKSDLPEMVPFTDPVSVTKYWEAFLEVTPSVTPTLTTEVGAWISCDPTIDKQGQDYMKSWFELYKNYDDMPIGDFTHLMFYVKVPETKENRLSICMFTETNFEYKIMANQPYALLQLGETEWKHYMAEDVKLNNYGGIVLPAGFEGFIKVPMESLLPAKVDATTKIRQICFRFGYIGMNEEACLWGGTFGVTKDNDPGPAEMVLSALPAATTNRKLYAIEEGDIFPDKIMIYWQPLENAATYTVEAYTVKRINKGYEYRLVNSETFFTNSGTISGLEMNTQYAILIKAKDADGNLIATYEYVRTKTASDNPYVMKGMSDEVKLDTVALPDNGNASQTDNFPLTVIIIIAAALLLLGGAVAVVIILIKKRRNTNV